MGFESSDGEAAVSAVGVVSDVGVVDGIYVTERRMEGKGLIVNDHS